ncbi:uncharacterized protein LOC62_05G006889 [Vanrija pseudolonga]|uniref:Uncharacterized protein n=1 Tax=Vanrija pseudolonga TaxID=143232 RepID=A0AAF0YB26_9TREE|nr:hypothetical protein LOC62_05G006889 [Vanrija pseudolonga]
MTHTTSPIVPENRACPSPGEWDAEYLARAQSHHAHPVTAHHDVHEAFVHLRANVHDSLEQLHAKLSHVASELEDEKHEFAVGVEGSVGEAKLELHEAIDKLHAWWDKYSGGSVAVDAKAADAGAWRGP